MRVGLMIYDSLDTVSGGYLYDRQLVHYLERCGDTVEVISLPNRRYTDKLKDNFSSKLVKKLKSADFDLILQDELNHPSLFHLNRQIQSAHRPIISIVHHLHIMENHPNWVLPFYREIEKTYLTSVDGFIFNSETTKRTVETLINSEKPHVIANPAGNRFDQIEINEEEKCERHSPCLRILFVGNIIPRKGLHTLLQAMAHLDNGMAQLRVVGNPHIDLDYRLKISDLIIDYRLLDQVTLMGQLSDEALLEQYQWADVLVMPSNYEGYGIVYLEGMRFGLPAIATNAGAAGELISHGQNGFLIDPNDFHSLMLHLRQLYSDRGLVGRMSHNARKRYNQHPTWLTSMARSRSFLQRMVSAQPTSRSISPAQSGD